jgi:hypothetical protein
MITDICQTLALMTTSVSTLCKTTTFFPKSASKQISTGFMYNTIKIFIAAWVQGRKIFSPDMWHSLSCYLIKNDKN